MRRYAYFPDDDLGRLNWHSNFIERFKLVAASLGFLPAEVTALEDDLKAHQFTFTLLGIAVSYKMN